jgi:hypothetical protein
VAQADIDYLNKTWDGGALGYIAGQQDRYKQAVASGSTELISKLEADAKRVGYNLTSSGWSISKPTLLGGTKTTTYNSPSMAQTIADTANNAGVSIDWNRFISIAILGIGGLAIFKIIFRR